MYHIGIAVSAHRKKLVRTFLMAVAVLGIILLLGLIVPDFVFSQPPSPPPAPRYGEPVPIDGGLGLLAAAGAAYAVRKLKKK